MKKFLSTIILALAIMPLFAVDVTFDLYQLIGKDITQLDYGNMTQIDIEKEYSNEGDLISINKEAMIYAVEDEFNEILTDASYSFAYLTTANNSNIIETVGLYILKIPEQSRNSFAYIAKQLFGSIDSKSILTLGSKEWYDNLMYYYDGEYKGYNVELSYHETSNYHLNEETQEVLIVLKFEK